MIFYVFHHDFAHPFGLYRKSGCEPHSARVRMVSYRVLLQRRRLPVATYVFTDFDRLTHAELLAAGSVWAQLEASGAPVRLLNHPLLAMQRYELLRTLHDAGVNAFDAYRLTETRAPVRYPVFIRRDSEHHGAETPLLASPEELQAATNSLAAQDLRLEDRIVVEFVDTSDRTGVYRKFGAFLVGERVIPRHCFFSREWLVKEPVLLDDEAIALEMEYVRTNPHERALRRIASIARIQYGRIDYGLIDGRLQIFEINTNPMTFGPMEFTSARRRPGQELFRRRFLDALDAIDTPTVCDWLPIELSLRRVGRLLPDAFALALSDRSAARASRLSIKAKSRRRMREESAAKKR